MGPIFKVIKIPRPNQQANIKVSQNIPLNGNTNKHNSIIKNVVIPQFPINKLETGRINGIDSQA